MSCIEFGDDEDRRGKHVVDLLEGLAGTLSRQAVWVSE